MQFEIAQRREIICFLHLRLKNLYYVQTSHFCGSVAADFDCVGRQERDEKIIAAFATGTLKIVARSRVIWERKTFQSSPINFSHFNARLTSEKKRFFFLHSFFFHAQSGCSGIEQKRTFLSRSNKERQALIFSSPFQTLLGSFGLGWAQSSGECSRLDSRYWPSHGRWSLMRGNGRQSESESAVTVIRNGLLPRLALSKFV